VGTLGKGAGEKQKKEEAHTGRKGEGKKNQECEVTSSSPNGRMRNSQYQKKGEKEQAC